jgi:two-component system, sensor histidine kinase and response regulator
MSAPRDPYTGVRIAPIGRDGVPQSMAHVMDSDSPTRDSASVLWLQTLCAEVAAPEGTAGDVRQVRAAFRSLVDSLPLNLLIKDVRGRRVFANDSYVRMRGTSLAEIVGKTDADLFPAELARKFGEDDERILRNGAVLTGFEEHVLPGGARTWIERIKSPLRDADGTIVGILVLFWDVTQRKEAQDALDRERYLLCSLMDNIPDAIYFKDRESRFLRISRAQAEKFALASPEEAVGRSDADIFSEEHAEQALADEREIMRTGEPMVARVEKETWPDREDTWVSTTKMPLRDNAGRVVGTFGISRDVTELKRTQVELREARDAAHAASRAKSDFLANMSHEIRTPMNAVIGMTELLLDTNLDQTQRDYLRMVQESGESLLGLLNDILDFSKIEAGQMELDAIPFDVREALGDTMKSLALRAHGKGLELAFSVAADVPVRLRGDPGRLRQVVVNLVGNAIKFTETGEVVLEVRCDGQRDGRAGLRLAVRDTGIGIPAHVQDRIFEEFQQAESSTTRTYGGTGLGLAISSRLVGLMGGRIRVESEPGQGSTFTFDADLEVCEVDPDEAPRRSVVVTDTRVLIVDDNATNRRILLDMTTNWGMQPALAASAAEALEELRAAVRRGRPCQLLLTDVNMPGASGFDLVADIRGEPSLAAIPVVMLTSSGRPGDVQRRSDLTVAAQLIKPVKQSELFDAIVSVLGVSAAEDEAAVNDRAFDDFRGARVLLAEDNVVNQKLALGVLGKLGCDVTIAGDGRRAFELWREGAFDVVLMDVQMPEWDGYEATKAIRDAEAGSGRRTPIVAMTAHAMTGDRERCLQAGMDDYLSKPVRIQQISEKLAAILRPAAEPAPGATASDSPEPVDWTYALEGVAGDRDLLRIVIEAFLEEVGPLRERLRAAVGQRDAAALADAAHTLKGALLSIGCRPAADATFALERLGAAGDLGECEASLSGLESRLDDLLPVLERETSSG